VEFNDVHDASTAAVESGDLKNMVHVV